MCAWCLCAGSLWNMRKWSYDKHKSPSPSYYSLISLRAGNQLQVSDTHPFTKQDRKWTEVPNIIYETGIAKVDKSCLYMLIDRSVKKNSSESSELYIFIVHDTEKANRCIMRRRNKESLPSSMWCISKSVIRCCLALQMTQLMCGVTSWRELWCFTMLFKSHKKKLYCQLQSVLWYLELRYSWICAGVGMVVGADEEWKGKQRFTIRIDCGQLLLGRKFCELAQWKAKE